MSIFTSISTCTSGKGEKSYKEYTDDDLNSFISKLYVGWTMLSKFKNIPVIGCFGDALSQIFLPSFMGGGKYFHHAFGWLELENGNSFLVEYDRKGYYIRKHSFKEFEKMKSSLLFQWY